jgi:hypothetical protein
MTVYEYYINVDERGEFRADVRDPSGWTVLDIEGFDIFEDGFMTDKYDLEGLREHLISIGVMESGDILSLG